MLRSIGCAAGEGRTSVVVTCVWESPPADPGFRECKCRASDPPQTPMAMAMVVAAIRCYICGKFKDNVGNFGLQTRMAHV